MWIPHRDLWATPHSEFYRDIEVKALVKKAERWRGSLLKSAGHMKLPDSEGGGYIAWGVADSRNMNRAHQAALTGACSQVRRLFHSKKVLFPAYDPRTQRVSLRIHVNQLSFQFQEVACWETKGKLKRAFIIEPTSPKTN